MSRRGNEPQRGLSPQVPDPDDESDWAVVWGKRLGRTVGFGLAVYLVWYLISTYGAAP